MSKQQLLLIVNEIVNNGYDEEDTILKMSASDENVYAYTLDSGRTDTTYSRIDNQDILTIQFPQYDEEVFVEDKKTALALDLSFILSKWENHRQKARAGRISAEGRKDKKDYYSELVKKRWAKK